MLNDTVSIIVPIYNKEKYLEKCLDSILGQTYRDLEIILVDDGSTDNSLAICQHYAEKDPRIKIYHKPVSYTHLKRRHCRSSVPQRCRRRLRSCPRCNT